MSSILEAEGLRKKYGDREVVRGISLKMNQGKSWAFSGRTERGRPRLFIW